jgi:phosphoserine phosphatase RsbU/P
MQILVVDDNEDVNKLLRIQLEDMGHDVVTASNGVEALERFNQGKFSVLISDWLMPRVDGLELCRRIRANGRPNYCYVILLTVMTGKANYLEASAAGVDDFISKPYDPDELKARLLVADRIVRLQTHVRRLEGVLSTCMYCKKIRDQNKDWVDIEEYISQRSEASFSHDVCPDCYAEHVKPEIDGKAT